MNVTTVMSPTTIGFCSTIGVPPEFPVDWGNYFSLHSKELGDIPILNMWQENLSEADKRFSLGGKVRIRIYEENGRKRALIDDDRIPKTWYYNKLCFRAGGVSKEVAKAMYDYLGDEDNEYEQFTDPYNYYKKRGQEYSETPDGRGIVSCVYKSKETVGNLPEMIIKKPTYFYCLGTPVVSHGRTIIQALKRMTTEQSHD